MIRGTVTSVEKVVVEVDVVDVVDGVEEVEGVVIHVMREVVIKDKIIVKMAEDSRQERMVSCACFCITLCGPV
jgi:hypothetical protein